MHFLPENRMCAPPFATKQRPPIWKILDPPLTGMLSCFVVAVFSKKITYIKGIQLCHYPSYCLPQVPESEALGRTLRTGRTVQRRVQRTDDRNARENRHCVTVSSRNFYLNDNRANLKGAPET